MKCPKCKGVDLKPAKLEADLPVMSCSRCEGSLLSLLYYRYWAEKQLPVVNESEIENELSLDKDTQTALSCPKCSKLMTKYSIVSQHKNKIDLCGSCDEVWLDGREWLLLKSLELSHTFSSVLTDQWQRNVRLAKMEAIKIDRLKMSIGSKDVEKAIEVKSWLRGNKNKSAILHFIGAD